MSKTWYHHCPICKQFVLKKDQTVFAGKECVHKFHRKCLFRSFPKPKLISTYDKALFIEDKRIHQKFVKALELDE